jgi:hypothetical protein
VNYSDLLKPWHCTFKIKEAANPAFYFIRAFGISNKEVRELGELAGDEFFPHDYEMLLEVKSGDKKWIDWSGSDEGCSEDCLIDDPPGAAEVWIPKEISAFSIRYIFRLRLRDNKGKIMRKIKLFLMFVSKRNWKQQQKIANIKLN